MEKLYKLITKKAANEDSAKECCGRFSSIMGILLNILLFAGKFAVGTIFSIVSVTADGFNNLSDAGSSLISFVSFKISGKPADREHPFGHARIEYITSMIISFIILMLSIELLKSSVEKIINPSDSVFSSLTIAVLVASIVIKLFLYFINRFLGRRVNSTVMMATSTDSLSDVLATTAVLMSVILHETFGWHLDGWMGVVVALFVMHAGYKILKETLNDLIGKAPDGDLTSKISSFICAYDGILGVHDLMVHSYGENRCFASAHAEVSGSEDIFESHDIIDRIEKDILEKMNIHLVIHLDPIVTDDEFVNEMRIKVIKCTEELSQDIKSTLSVHDFRMVSGTTHTNLIFDIAAPFDCKYTNKQLQNMMQKKISEQNNTYYSVITVDRQ